jgi:hypothetical protein
MFKLLLLSFYLTIGLLLSFSVECMETVAPSSSRSGNFLRAAAIVLGSEMVAMTIKERNFATTMGAFKTITGAAIGLGIIYETLFRPETIYQVFASMEKPRVAIVKENLEQRGIITSLLDYSQKI